MTNDPSFALIADDLSPDSDIGECRCSVAAVVAVYAAAAENAARENQGGWFSFDLRAIAHRLGLSTEIVRAILSGLEERGHIDRDERDGGYFFIAWDLDHALPEAEANAGPKTPLRITRQKPKPERTGLFDTEAAKTAA